MEVFPQGISWQDNTCQEKNIKKIILITLFGLFLVYSVIAGEQQSKWDIANLQIKRLSPDVFIELPSKIVQELKKQNYTIPQSYRENKPHNVISGEFAKKGQIDWAVLCSRNLQSSILIFWGGSEKNISEIALSPDKHFLQGIGEGKIGYSRRLSVVGEKYIIEHYNAYGGNKPPPIEHRGINDAFIGKASIVHYYYNGKWLQLTGAD